VIPYYVGSLEKKLVSEKESFLQQLKLLIIASKFPEAFKVLRSFLKSSLKVNRFMESRCFSINIFKTSYN
jgi:hypothetical protein